MQRSVLPTLKLCVLPLLLLLPGCDTAGGPARIGLAPRSEIVEPTEPSGTLTVDDGTPITFRWRCVDPEEQMGLRGGIVAIEIQLGGGEPMLFECPPDEGEWWFSSSAESGSTHHILSNSIPTGGTRAHSFRVRAQDITGLWESWTDAAHYVFGYNHPPSSEILSPAPSETLGPSFTVTWEGTDVDGDVAEYQYVLDPAQSDWEYTSDTSRSYVGVATGEHEFRLRAKDGSDCWAEEFSVVSFHVE